MPLCSKSVLSCFQGREEEKRGREAEEARRKAERTGRKTEAERRTGKGKRGGKGCSIYISTFTKVFLYLLP